MTKKFIYTLLFVLVANNSDLIAQSPKLAPESIDEVIESMTLREKASMVCGIGLANWQVPTMLVPGAAGTTYAIPHLGITPSVVTDGPAGVHINIDGYDNKKVYCTAYPVNTALAASWDISVLEEVGKSVADEVLANGLDLILAPSMNIHRNILCGRNFEYYSEDPVLSGEMGAAYVRGVQSMGVGACIKHFVANNQETNRMTYNAVISQRALREIYLRGFEIAVKKGRPWALMTTYNMLNGHYTSENMELLKDIVRSEWKYDGLVMTDWNGGKDPVAQMRAGNELIMPGNWQVDVIEDAVENGLLEECILDRNVRYILEYILKTPRYKGYKPSGKPDKMKNAEVSRRAASESMVLLENEGALPLSKKDKKIALFGKSSYSTIAGGTGSGAVNCQNVISIYQAMKESGFALSPRLDSIYCAYMGKAKAEWTDKDWYLPEEHAVTYYPELDLDEELIQEEAERMSMAVITIGRCSGEGWDRNAEDYFELSGAEQNLISKVSKAFHREKKKVVVILNVSGAIETVSWRDKVDAVLVSWLPGQEAGYAVVDILSGKVNPSGKLAMTYPVSYKDSPSSDSFPGEPEDNPVNSLQDEGIYVGYRYYSTFGKSVAYEFGYGKSYTVFEYSGLELSESEDTLVVTWQIKNIGRCPGKEISQLYISSESERLDKPVLELKGFHKTGLLAPGESETVSIPLTKRDFASFWSGSSKWIVDKGDYHILIGASSSDIRLKDKIHHEVDTVVEEVYDVLYPNVYINDLSRKAR